MRGTVVMTHRIVNELDLVHLSVKRVIIVIGTSYLSHRGHQPFPPQLQVVNNSYIYYI